MLRVVMKKVVFGELFGFLRTQPTPPLTPGRERSPTGRFAFMASSGKDLRRSASRRRALSFSRDSLGSESNHGGCSRTPKSRNETLGVSVGAGVTGLTARLTSAVSGDRSTAPAGRCAAYALLECTFVEEAEALSAWNRNARVRWSTSSLNEMQVLSGTRHAMRRPALVNVPNSGLCQAAKSRLDFGISAQATSKFSLTLGVLTLNRLSDCADVLDYIIVRQLG